MKKRKEGRRKYPHTLHHAPPSYGLHQFQDQCPFIKYLLCCDPDLRNVGRKEARDKQSIFIGLCFVHIYQNNHIHTHFYNF